MQNIPFLSLAAQHDLIRDELEQGFRKVIDGRRFILGEEVTSFEREFAAYCGVKYCVSVGNGFDALYISLKALGVGAGDEVIVPALTCAPTWMAVSMTGAMPVGVDVDARSFNINVNQIENAITKKTKAIVPVNLYGRPAALKEITAIAEARKIFIVEDNAQAQGAHLDGKKTGTFGNINATSFYPTKNLGALGDAGAITTNDTDLARKASALRNYGSSKRFANEEIGINSRLDELQASVLRIKLRHLDQWNHERNLLAARYRVGLENVSEISIPADPRNGRCVDHLFVICCMKRDQLRSYLGKQGVETDIHYPVPPHLQEAYIPLGHKMGSFPVTEKICNSILSLPLWPGMTLENVDYIVDSLQKFFTRKEL